MTKYKWRLLLFILFFCESNGRGLHRCTSSPTLNYKGSRKTKRKLSKLFFFQNSKMPGMIVNHLPYIIDEIG